MLKFVVRTFAVASILVSTTAYAGNTVFGSLAFTNGSLFATDFSYGDNTLIYKLDSELKTATKVFERFGEGPAAGLATDGSSLYFSEQNTIYKTTLSGQVIGGYSFGAQNQIGSLVFAGGSLFAAEVSFGDNTILYKLDSGLRTASRIIERFGEAPINGIATDGSSLYLSQDNAVLKTSFTGQGLGAYRFEAYEHIGSLAFAGGSLYATDFSFGEDASVYKLDSGLRTANKVIDWFGDRPFNGLATDGANLYLSEGNTIFKTTLNGQKLGSFVLQDQPGVPTPPAASVPEPATWMQMFAGFLAIGATMRRRRTIVSFG